MESRSPALGAGLILGFFEWFGVERATRKKGPHEIADRGAQTQGFYPTGAVMLMLRSGAPLPESALL